MTEGLREENDKSMCVRVWLEVGHACEPRRSALGRALALDWRVWVRGASGNDISSFVHKVVFHLHPASAFVYPKRVLQEPPYEIQESGCASIEIPIHVYLKYTSRPKKIRLRYSLQIQNNWKSNSESRCVFYDFENPSEPLRKSLMKGGGEVIARSGSLRAGGDRLLVVQSDVSSDDSVSMKPKKHKFTEPVHCKHAPKKRPPSCILDEVCAKCGCSTNFKVLLRSVHMTDDEINKVSQLYLAYNSYEKSSGALNLPPMSDPIYRVPELPASLRGAITNVDADYAML